MTYDLVSIGRVNMDLFSRDIGAEFRDIRSFDAMVGGSPANIAISSARLGLNTALLTAVGEDKVGSFVLGYLEDERVETAHIATKPQKTSLALLGVQPPDRFPLEFYRDDPADIHLTPEEVERFPWKDTKAFQLSGNALSRGVGAEAAVRATELAVEHGLERYIDLDLRPVEWREPRAFGEAVRGVLGHLTVVIGTEEEVWAALSSEPELVMGGEKLAADKHDELLLLATSALERYPQLKAIIVKRGPAGATVVTIGAQ
ncbi:MAG: 5-dehydro-2-deoxygluconokinase, partial [Acidimicrobiia bacterium]|nr:5-dehydro-2-deoxygluconokinase [Acidimicrobiia bacterium]